MDFALICRDGPDAAERRAALRGAHLEGMLRERANGTLRDGGMILNEKGVPVGSLILCRFPSRAALDRYLEGEVFRVQNVWQTVEVIEMRFVDLPPQV